ncbi:metalloproteinase inhibitor 4 isoform X2 [Hyla sarda]|uniref:metalloproteinase inhibitor 4 isoform X2 n=1 Tax=Hyla sarda TaxID=327740 RepID=UPI0024C28704|nr:metalloproteinase inhibitor 4 isoform X2 [Hyla sarda]
MSQFHQLPKEQTLIRARVIGEKKIPTSGRETLDMTTQYEIKLTKILKVYGEMTDIHYVYTPSESSVCGVKLEKREYVLGGKIYNNKVNINLCGLVSVWENLSSFQRESLTKPDMGYQKGCVCKIKYCGMDVCDSPTQDLECTWKDWQQTQTLEREHACMKSGKVCRWHPIIADKSIFASHP